MVSGSRRAGHLLCFRGIPRLRRAAGIWKDSSLCRVGAAVTAVGRFASIAEQVMWVDEPGLAALGLVQVGMLPGLGWVVPGGSGQSRPRYLEMAKNSSPTATANQFQHTGDRPRRGLEEPCARQVRAGRPGRRRVKGGKSGGKLT